jgi:protein-disulfide isomerase
MAKEQRAVATALATFRLAKRLKRKRGEAKAAGAEEKTGGPGSEKLLNVGMNAFYSVALILIVVVFLIAILLLFPRPAATSFRQTAGEMAQQRQIEDVSLSTGNLPPLGNANASVKLVEFSDFECPYCTGFYKLQERGILKDYINTGRVALYYRDLPLRIHDKAEDAALAARCANEQGKFWEMHNILFDKNDEWSVIQERYIGDKFKSYAASLGLDNATFGGCYDGLKYATDIDGDRKEAAAAGITLTPTFAIIVQKAQAPDIESLMSAIRAKQAPGIYTSIRLAQQNDNYVLIVEGSQPYEVFTSIFDSVKSP